MSAFESLAAYVNWLDEVPLPTYEQRERFADYVSHARSWYKSLSPYPPGVPFYFFLNKYAGWAREHGTPLVWERRVGGMNRSEIPTDVYQEAFGSLDYSTRGDRAPLVTERRVVWSRGWPDDSPGVGQLAYGLPDEILEAGATLATAVIHTLSATSSWMWEEEQRPSPLQWPENSGGLDTLERIFERHRQRQQPGFSQVERPIVDRRKNYPSASGYDCLVDPVMHELLLPERNRQQLEMIAAMTRVCDIVRSSRDSSSATDTRHH